MSRGIYEGLLGMAIGDALGAPAESKSREEVDQNPITAMAPGGPFQVEKGTWADDTAMALSTVAALTGGLDLDMMMQELTRWMTEGFYTPHGEALGVGMATRMTIEHYMQNGDIQTCGIGDEGGNGNGALARTAPLAFVLVKDYGYGLAQSEEAMNVIHSVTSLTHCHPMSQIACGIYQCLLARMLDPNRMPWASEVALVEAREYYQNRPEFAEAFAMFDRIFDESFFSLNRADIESTGFVVDTLEASLWSFFTTSNFKDAVLKAVNLGDNGDTIGALTGMLAAVTYGQETIPQEWVDDLVQKDIIKGVADDLQRVLDVKQEP